MSTTLHVKTIPCIVVATMLLTTSTSKALFGHVAVERDRREHAEQQFEQQQHTNEHLHIAISVLSASAVIMLITGAAIGSKTRRDHETIS